MMKYDLLLIIVAYHPSQHEVSVLSSCLNLLPSNIGYAVVANDYIDGEPVDDLSDNCLKFIRFRKNLG